MNKLWGLYTVDTVEHYISKIGDRRFQKRLVKAKQLSRSINLSSSTGIQGFLACKGTKEQLP